MTDPICIENNGHRTWLKWHRGRRRASDPAFTGARILEGMRLGASVEVDLVVHAEGGFAILHDLTLERETTGTGPVRAAGASGLRQLHLRGNDGQAISDRVMLLEDLCALLAANPPHAEALLQLDFKEDLAALTPAVIANFGRSAGPMAGNLILSGGDADAIGLLAETAPGLRTGYDPCYGEALSDLRASGNFAGFIADALAIAPDAQMIYLDYEIVLAADQAGFDIIAPIHADGRRIDAWTIREITPTTIDQARRLLALRVDQITTDHPEGLAAALVS